MNCHIIASDMAIRRAKGDQVVTTKRIYDTIGVSYTATRRTEPRIAAKIWATLESAHTVLNVGAGTGSYEPRDRDLIAVEPSAVMRGQRPADAAPCIAATADRLPFPDQSFDAAMAVLTDHHWPDPIAGLREMRRVAHRVVVFNFDAAHIHEFWLTRDYLPELTALAAGHPTMAQKAEAIGARLEKVVIPWDCTDGFLHAFWRRPEQYLYREVRNGISLFAAIGPKAEQRMVKDLRADLDSGRWADRNRDITGLDEADMGARLLIA
jgi:SAM-dependent methyltransferase